MIRSAPWLGPGYFSFTSESFFFPLGNAYVASKPNLTYLQHNADVVILNLPAGYTPPTLDGDGFLTWTHTWTRDPFTLKDDNFVFQFRITNYGKPSYEGRTVYLKSLEFTFWPVPLEKRNPVVRFLTDLLT